MAGALFSKAIPLLVVFLGFRFAASQTCGIQKSTDPLNLQAQFSGTTTTPYPTTTSSTYQSNKNYGSYSQNSTGYMQYQSGNQYQMMGSNPYPSHMYHRYKRAVNQRPLDKIVGGTPVVDPTGGQLCWQIFLRVQFPNGAIESYCGGVIVGLRTIVTAAHCVVDEKTLVPYDPAQVTVSTGVLSSNTNNTSPNFGMFQSVPGCGETFQVQSIHSNPNYNPNTFNNDIAVLVLQNPIDLSKPCVCQVCLETKEPAIGEICAVSGYGDTKLANKPDMEPLKWLKVNILQNVEQNCPLNNGTDPNLFICAGADNENTDAFCQGDSGGPLVCFDNEKTNAYYLAGLVDFAVEGCLGNGLQFTKVKSFFNFILDNSDGTLQIAN